MNDKLIKNLIGLSVIMLSCIAYADAKFDGGYLAVRLPNNETFGYYSINKIILRASCFGSVFVPAHHHELYNNGDISSLNVVTLPTKQCRNGNREIGMYELKFLTASGEYKCGSINTRGEPHGTVDVRTLEKTQGMQLQHCTWTYNGHGMDSGDRNE